MSHIHRAKTLFSNIIMLALTPWTIVVVQIYNYTSGLYERVRTVLQHAARKITAIYALESSVTGSASWTISIKPCHVMHPSTSKKIIRVISILRTSYMLPVLAQSCSCLLIRLSEAIFKNHNQRIESSTNRIILSISLRLRADNVVTHGSTNQVPECKKTNP